MSSVARLAIDWVEQGLVPDAVAFEDQGPSDWMSRHFFSGGVMPSDESFRYRGGQQWWVSHYLFEQPGVGA